MAKDIHPSPQAMAAAFAEAAVPLDKTRLEKFWRLHELLEARNPAGDLTRVNGFRGLLYKHYIDGAKAAEFINPVGLTMDLGTGAGFPGLPLALMRPDWSFLLAEPRGKRLAFMEEAVTLLNLENVDFYPHKVGPRFDRPIENFITRDFEAAAESLKRAALIIPPGGRVYLMKGPKVDSELNEAMACEEWSQFETESDKAYVLGQSGLKRRLITWRKKDGGRRPAAPPPYAIKEISSRENPRFKSWLKSLGGRGQKKSGQAIISGRKFVKEILEGPLLPGDAALIIKRADDLQGFQVPPAVTVYQVRPELFPDLDLYGAGPPLMVMPTPPLPRWPGQLAEGLTVFLPFQDPANLGTAIRTATALGAKVVILAEAASPWHPKSLRASGPSVLAADLMAGPTLAELARTDLLGLMALSPTGPSLLGRTWPERAGFVFGLEGPGLGPDWPEERRLSIPMAEGVESLNAAAALAVALGVWRARHR